MDLLTRLSVAEPGYKVTITQDFYSSLPGPRPRTRQRSIEMFRPKQWEDLTRIQPQMLAPGTVISAKVEVAPCDKEAREDFNKFVQEMVQQNSNNGFYDHHQLTGVMIEARLPQLPLFQGSKVPKVSSGANESVSLPLGPDFQKILGDSVRIYIHHDNLLSRTVFPAILSFKTIMFLVVLLVPVLGTCLSLVLADKATLIVFKKRYSRRKNMVEALLEDKMSLQRIKLTRHFTQDLLQFKDEAKPGGEAEVEADPGVDQNVRILNSIIEEVGSMSGGEEALSSEASVGQSKASEALVEVEEGPRGGGGQARDMPPSYSGLEVAT